MSKMRLLTVTIIVAAAAGWISGETNKRDNFREEYDNFLKEARQEYNDFRKQINKDYADFLAAPWQEVKPVFIKKPVEPPVPPRPIYDNKEREDREIRFEDLVTPVIPKPVPQPVPVEPIVVRPTPTDEWVAFTYLGNTDKVRHGQRQAFGWYGADEGQVARTWKEMSDSRLDATLSDCLALRAKYRMIDWAYLEMLNALAQTVYPNDISRARMLVAWLYCQSGYRIRMARDHNGYPVMLFACDNTIFGPCFNLDGRRYYPYSDGNMSLYISNASFPKERTMSLVLSQLPLVPENMSKPRTIKSKLYPEMNCTVSVNKNLIDFFNRYPNAKINDNIMTRWANYANTPLSDEVVEALYPRFKEELRGKTDLEKVSRLLNWVQTGLVYEYDDKVWGQDRAFFPDETLYYPYADCEDRAILFSRLVRDIVGLDVLLIYYPGHLSTAVRFKEPVPGDFIKVNGATYTVCDPTFTEGAPVGCTGTGNDNSTATVILLDR